MKTLFTSLIQSIICTKLTQTPVPKSVHAGAEITMLRQQAIDCLKRYIIKSDIPKNVNKEFIAATVKVDKHLIMTRIQKHMQKKITNFFK